MCSLAITVTGKYQKFPGATCGGITQAISVIPGKPLDDRAHSPVVAKAGTTASPDPLSVALRWSF